MGFFILIAEIHITENKAAMVILRFEGVEYMFIIGSADVTANAQSDR